MREYLKETFNLQLKLLQTTDEEARKGIEDELALKEGQMNELKTFLNNYKVPEAFGESLPQAILQLYIIFMKAKSLDNIFDILNDDFDEHGWALVFLSTYFALATSAFSLTLTVSGMTQYWMKVKGHTISPTQGLGMTLKILPFMFPVVLSRVTMISISLASTHLWWLKLVLFVIPIIVYTIGFLVMWTLYKKQHPEETFEKTKDLRVLQFVSSYFAPCVWINPKLDLLVYTSIVSAFSHISSFFTVLTLCYTCPQLMNIDLIGNDIETRITFENFISTLALILLFSCIGTYSQWRIIRRFNFRVACAGNDLEMVKTMLENDAKAKIEEDQVQGCFGSVLRTLTSLTSWMRPNINFNECNKFGQTGLFEAVFEKHDKLIDMIVAHAQQLQINLQFKDVIGRTGLGVNFRKV